MSNIDGIEIHIEGTGAETIVMVHGWPDTHRLWDDQVAALKDRYRCVRFTLPGFDRAHPRRARTLDELVDFFRRVVEEVSPGRPVILLLHDWGAIIGCQFYARHPQLVSRIVSVDIGDLVSLKREVKPREGAMIFGYQAWLALAWKFGGALGDRMTRYMARRARCPSDPAEMHAGMDYPYWMLWFAGKDGWRPQFRAFEPEVPTLYIYGRRKPFMIHAWSWVEQMRRDPRHRVEEFQTGHWVMAQEPERFNRVVREWLEVSSRGA
jgi:pimeloyl-ACP methyl ester carboxylesterase